MEKTLSQCRSSSICYVKRNLIPGKCLPNMIDFFQLILEVIIILVLEISEIVTIFYVLVTVVSSNVVSSR